AHILSDFLKFAGAKIAKQVRRLGVADALLNALDLIFNVTVCDENVRPAVIIVIEEKATKAESNQGRPSHIGARRFVDKQAVPLIVIKGDHLVGKVRD